MDKPIILQFEADAKTVRMLRRCCEALCLTEEEVLCRGVKKVYDALENQKKQPNESLKSIPVNFMLDEETNRELNICVETLQETKSDIVRKGILKVAEDLQNK